MSNSCPVCRNRKKGLFPSFVGLDSAITPQRHISKLSNNFFFQNLCRWWTYFLKYVTQNKVKDSAKLQTPALQREHHLRIWCFPGTSHYEQVWKSRDSYILFFTALAQALILIHFLFFLELRFSYFIQFLARVLTTNGVYFPTWNSSSILTFY